MLDIAIVGGGPGGLVAARELAARGFDVAVFEEHPAAGEPVHCTGVLALEAFDQFEITRESILNPLKIAEFVGPSGASIEYSTKNIEAVVIDRRVFDQTLCNWALAAGARIQTGVKVSDVQVSDTAVAIRTGGGFKIAARACVLACGANYVIQRRLGLGMPGMHLQSAQIELPAGAPGNVEVHFGEDVAPRGFAWAVPVRRGERSFARVGLMCDRDARGYFDRFVARIGSRWHLRSAECQESISPRMKVLPLAPIEQTYTTRLLAVGDAAGLVKATTGGGIYYSLLSGSIAADVLAAALHRNDLSDSALSLYQERWRAQLGDELNAQKALRTIADRMSDAEIDELFELARTDGIMPIVRRTASFNRHRDLIVSLLAHPPARRVFMRRVLGWTSAASIFA